MAQDAAPARIAPEAAVMAFGGLIAPLGVFNTVSVGSLPIDMLWLIGGFALLWSRVPLSGLHLIFIGLLTILVAKAGLSGNVSYAAKMLAGVVFLGAMCDVRNLTAFFSGYHVGLVLSLCFAAYQLLIWVTGGDLFETGALIDVTLWNVAGWHASTPDPFGLPRLSGLSFEPAYLAITMLVALVYELFVRREPVRPLLVAMLVLGILVANSRVGFVSLLAVLLCAGLVQLRAIWLLRGFFGAAALAPILPVFFVYAMLFDYEVYRDVIDISVFARYLPFALFYMLDPLSQMVGVVDYRAYILQTPFYEFYAQHFVEQGIDRDPKSLLASNLFQFGIMGSLFLYGGVLSICWGNARALAVTALGNLIFFNIYAYSWPLFWVVQGMAVILLTRAARRPS